MNNEKQLLVIRVPNFFDEETKKKVSESYHNAFGALYNVVIVHGENTSIKTEFEIVR